MVSKFIRIITVILFSLLALAWFLLNSIHVQTFLGHKISDVLSQEIGIPVHIERLVITLPDTVHLLDISVGGQENDILKTREITLKFSFKKLLWSGKISIPSEIDFTAFEVHSKDVFLPSLTGSSSSESSLKGTHTNLLVKGFIDAYPFSISTTILQDRKNNLLSLNAIIVDIIGIQLVGDLHLAMKEKQLTGNLSTLPIDLTKLPSFLQTSIFDSVGASILFKENNSIEALIAVKSFNLEEYHIEQLDLSATITDLFKAPKIHVVIDADNIRYKTFNLEQFQSSGSWDCKNNDYEYIVKTLKGDFNGYSYTIEKEFFLTCKENNIELFDLLFLMHLHNLQSLLDDHLTITVNSSITGTYANPKITLSFNNVLNNMESRPLGKLESTFDDHQISVIGNFTLPHLPEIHFEAATFRDFFCFPFKPDSIPLSGKINIQGEIAPLYQLLLNDSTLLTGDISADLDLSGTLKNPHVDGVCDLRNGGFEITSLGTLLKNLNARFEIADSMITLSTLEAKDTSDGTVTGSGSVLLDISKGIPFHIDMELENVILLNQDNMQASASGFLNFSGGSSSGDITGLLQTNDAVITLPESSKQSRHHVEVTFINVPAQSLAPKSFTHTPSSWPLTLNINLNIPDNLTIKGNDLSSQWKGGLSIQGSTENPLYFGSIKILYGQYFFNGKPFEINQGVVMAAGELDKKTVLYVIATKDLEEVKIDVIIKGPTNKPIISFRSNPPLPQREILSWLLFDRGSSEISSFQGSQLNESISNLGSTHQGADILTKIRSALGIDRFEIVRNNTSDEGSVDFKVGKYISDNVLISINKSDVNTVSVEASLSKKIKLQAQVGDDAEAQILLNWKRDY